MNTSLDHLNRTAPFVEGFEHYPRMVLLLGRSGEVIALNRLSRKRLGMETEGALPDAVHIEDVFSGTRDRLMKDVFAGATGGRLCLRGRAPTKEGANRFGFQVTPLREGTRVLRFLLTETLTRAIPQAFESLNTKVREANEAAADARRRHRQLQDSYQSLEQFSYVAAHDLQAPLRNIATLIRFVEEDHGPEMSEDARGLLGSARDSADQLQCLITDLLAHAKSSAADLNLQQVDLSSVVTSVTRNLSTEIAVTAAQVDVAPDLGAVTADPVMLHQLLENLIGNALKYRNPARAPHVTISRDPGSLERDRLLIRDNGLGFDPAQTDRLFTAFQRLHSETDIPGTGIGLTTCRTICDRHGWRIDAEGWPDKGACFRISGLR